MKITGFDRTVVRVPFVPNILSNDEDWHYRSSYPENLDRRCHDVLRVHTDAGVVGLGMSNPYYGNRENDPPDWKGMDPLDFEPRSLRGGNWSMAMLDLIAKSHEVPLYRIFGGKVLDRVLIDYWMHATSVADSAAAARRAAEMGFRGITTKGKLVDPLEERFRAMAEAAPLPDGRWGGSRDPGYAGAACAWLFGASGAGRPGVFSASGVLGSVPWGGR